MHISIKKQSRIVAGIMSGTSLDGIDCVILSIKRKSNDEIKWKLLSHSHVKFPPKVRDTLLRNSIPSTSRVDEINDLNQLLPRYYAQALKQAAGKIDITLSRIDLVGCHGQTIYHRPRKEKRFGRRFGATLQIGEPSTLAILTGIPVVGNFRSADVAAGGQGAPLVPYAEYLMFKSKSRSRLLLNIGGIANMTYLPKNARLSDVVAFDTGPGNIVINELIQKYFNKPFDKNGATARKGVVNETLFLKLLSHPYLKKKPPKSTGREEFGNEFIKKLHTLKPKNCSPTDLITTLSEFTAWTIFHAYCTYVTPKEKIDEIIVSGGGAKNRYVMDALVDYFEGIPIYSSKEFGIPVEAKEAACFAVLANETIDGRPGNLPSVTGAARQVPLGVVAYPSET